MRKLFKQLISFFLIPLTRWYLRKERNYTYHHTTVTILPGVFHPGLFYSTKFLIDFLLTQPIRNKSLLELGCGTGLISIISAKEGAIVTASDISEQAIENVTANAKLNQLSITITLSDVFDLIEQKQFDWIIINPPYYARTPKNEAEHAWHCGENFEYFHKLFRSLTNYIHPTSQVIMVLTQGCELEKIFEVAVQYGFQFELLMERNVLFDGKDFLYRIKHADYSFVGITIALR
ncbi:MAG: methyltransferase [Cyclobacteriaceae bacterium]